MFSRSRGFTLTEMSISILLMVVAAFLVRVGLQFINGFTSQKLASDNQRESQNSFYMIGRDIRNAKKIVAVTEKKLTLSTFNVAKYGFTDPNLFEPVNIGTTTYEYNSEAMPPYLERRSEYPGQDARISKYLVDMMAPISTATYLFRGGPGINPPYDTVEIVLRLKQPLNKNGSPEIYREVVLRRSGQ